MGEIGKELAAALAAAQAEMPAIPKGGCNKFDKYRYSTLEDIHNAIAPALKKHGLALVAGVSAARPIEGGRETTTGKHDNAIIITGSLTVIHGATGQYLTVEGAGEGQDRADKGMYKAITGMRKYVLCQMFHLITSDDPERDEKVGLGNGGGAGKPPKASEPEAGALDDGLDGLM